MARLEGTLRPSCPLPRPATMQLPPGALAPVPSLSRASVLLSYPLSYPPDAHCDWGISTSRVFQGGGSVNSIAQLRETLHHLPGATGTKSMPSMVHR